jgi:hypothetical protein
VSSLGPGSGIGRGTERLWEGPPQPAVPQGLETYAHIEGLVGEEAELLEIPHEKRSQQHHERLHAIREELDRVWGKLRERAERREDSGEERDGS